MDPNVLSSRSRIAILGAGSVGSSIALCLILNPVASEVILVDPKVELRDAQVKDLGDATTYHGAVGWASLCAISKTPGINNIVVAAVSRFAAELTKMLVNAMSL